MPFTDSEFIRIPWRNHFVDIEFRWVGVLAPTHPGTMVFLHEGLGSVALWKDFPDSLCQQLGLRGLVYSRPGYGKSTSRATNEPLPTQFMHQQAWEVLPTLLAALEVKAPPYLFGHSDGASIALLHAARFTTKGCVALAPHVFVEPVTVRSIEAAKQAFLNTNLKSKFKPYHDDVDSAFWGWNQVWLSSEFRDWNIQTEIASIACPVLLIQGLEDEYATLKQLDEINQAVPHATRVVLENCQHSPHKDQPDRVLEAVQQWLAPLRSFS